MLSVDERIKACAASLTELGKHLSDKRAVAMHLSAQYDALEDESLELNTYLGNEEKAAAILLLLEEQWRKDFEQGVSELVTEGINVVFDTDDVFRIVATTRAGTSAVRFELERPRGTVDLFSDGGSLVEVVSFLLRVVVTLAYQPKLRRVIVLDEAFKAVSEEFKPNLAALLRDIVDESGIQLIFVTHDPAYMEVADTVYEIEKKTPDALFADVGCLKRGAE